MKVKASNIQWDVDNEHDLEALPKELTVDVEADDEEEAIELASDAISDENGFCHKGFEADVLTN